MPLGIRDSNSAAPNNILPATIVTTERMKSSALRIAFLDCARPKVSRDKTIRSPPTIPMRPATGASEPKRRLKTDAAIIIASVV